MLSVHLWMVKLSVPVYRDTQETQALPAPRLTSVPPPRAKTGGSATTTTQPSPAPASRVSRATSASLILQSVQQHRAITRGSASRRVGASPASVPMGTLEMSARRTWTSVCPTRVNEEHAQTWMEATGARVIQGGADKIATSTKMSA